jgi:transglutaminase-like putative cysteine protease
MTSPLRQTGTHPLSAVDTARYLSATPRINSDHPEISTRQKELLAVSSSTEHSVNLLARWVAGYLEDTVLDSSSSLEALQLRSGNCQSHARLYVALARAAGIPTRMVSGLVYAKGKGFLYHSWAESYLNGWIAIDPTFAQIPADVTHIRLIEGDEPDEMAPLAGIIGRIRAGIVEIVR